jgi:cellulose synthase/poly-beta-1,6-N-acetylglucosamine synthase-like glycosyltransferase
MQTPQARVHAVLRIFTATLGVLPIALLSSAALARFLPLSRDAAFAVAYVALIPTWVTAMCFGFLAKSGARALALSLGITLLLWALLATSG